MADIEYFEEDRGYGSEGVSQHHVATAEGASRVGAVVNWAGAVVSLGLVVGMCVWAFQLTMRDVSGVPVVRALEGPMRVPPEDPGGAQAPHQGLAVNRIAEGEEAGPVPDRLVLAPPPVDLDEIDLSSASIPEVTEVPAPTMANPETQALIDRLMSRGERLAPVEQAAAAPVAPAVPAAPAPASEPDSEVAPTPAAAPEAAQIIPASVPGVSRSLRPLTRPASLRAPAAPATSEDGAAAGTGGQEGDLELPPETLPVGTRLVQLGAFDSPDLARSEWQRLVGRFPDFFAGRARVIQEASSGGSSFFRLRAHGFDDLAASRRFCAVLVAEGAPCIPVTVR